VFAGVDYSNLSVSHVNDKIIVQVGVWIEGVFPLSLLEQQFEVVDVLRIDCIARASRPHCKACRGNRLARLHEKHFKLGSFSTLWQIDLVVLLSMGTR
jgi:hypothetical protein